MTRLGVRIDELWSEQCIRIFIDLFSCLEIFFIAPVIFELAFVGRVLATDLWSSFVDPTAEVTLQVLARRVNQQVPIVIVNKDRRAVVQQVPTHEVKITTTDRFVNRQGEVMTALGSAMFTQVCGRRKVASPSSGRWGNRRHDDNGNKAGAANKARVRLQSRGSAKKPTTTTMWPIGPVR